MHRNAHGYCDAHADDAKAWARKPTESKSTTERGYGWFWQKLRRRILERDRYLCQVCMSEGRITEGTEVDHIINKARGGTDDKDNLQTICKLCHETKTLQESRS